MGCERLEDLFGGLNIGSCEGFKIKLKILKLPVVESPSNKFHSSDANILEIIQEGPSKERFFVALLQLICAVFSKNS